MGNSKRLKRRAKREQAAALRRQNVSLPPSVASGYAVQATMYSGPVPPPDMLRDYDAIEPGRGARLMNLIEDQARHRMFLEKKVISADVWRSWAGLACGFVIALAFLGAGVHVIGLGHPVSGTTLSTTAIVGLVGTFVYGTQSQRKERVEKAKMMSGRK